MELKDQKIAILGYGNQGRAQALNLRDSGVSVVIGSRRGKSFLLAQKDGFKVTTLIKAAHSSGIVVLLLPDQVIGPIHDKLKSALANKYIGFAHGFAYHFGQFSPVPSSHYFLVGPKGAGSVLRQRFLQKKPLPGVFGADTNDPKTLRIAVQYAKAIGLGSPLIQTSFKEETLCDLFGEQAVLCGGLMQLMEEAFKTLVRRGVSPKMAFFECCYEVKTIIDLWLASGPAGMTQKISPTAFFGGTTRGKRLVNTQTKKELRKIFREIESGAFAKEWLSEVKRGTPLLSKERLRLRNLRLNRVYQEIARQLN